MSRSGYSEDCDSHWDWIRWRGTVASAIRGRRGQSFFMDMLAALDALPAPRLAAEVLEAGADVCAIGSLGRARGIDMSGIDPNDPDTVAGTFGIATALAAEVAFRNDDVGSRRFIRDALTGNGSWHGETPEERFTRMRAWIQAQIRRPGTPT